MFLNRSLLTVFLVFFLSCKSTDEVIEDEANCIGDYSTENVLTNINEEIFNDDESVNTYSRYSWSSSGESRILRGNGIPNHEVGTFPNSGNPNRIRWTSSGADIASVQADFRKMQQVPAFQEHWMKGLEMYENPTDDWWISPQ